MSEGIKSGVNCTRLASRPSTVPSVSTSFVLARPGTPTRRPCPPDRSVISAPSTTLSCPKITAWIAARADFTSAAVLSADRMITSSRLVAVSLVIVTSRFAI
jgi:hypothetical protein